MARKITDRTAIDAVVDADVIGVVDVSDTSQAASGSSKQATRAQVVAGLALSSHTHPISDLSDGGALAGKDTVATADIDPGALAAVPDGGAFNPAAIDLSSNADYGYTQAGAVALTLDGGITPVGSASATVAWTGDGANVTPDGTTVKWWDGTSGAKSWSGLQHVVVRYSAERGHAVAFVTGQASGGGTDDQTAAEVPYDNTISGLTGTDVKAAIDELSPAGDSHVSGDANNTLTTNPAIWVGTTANLPGAPDPNTLYFTTD